MVGTLVVAIILVIEAKEEGGAEGLVEVGGTEDVVEEGGAEGGIVADITVIISLTIITAEVTGMTITIIISTMLINSINPMTNVDFFTQTIFLIILAYIIILVIDPMYTTVIGIMTLIKGL